MARGGKKSEGESGEILERYGEILKPAAMELIDFKFKLAKYQRDLAEELERETWSGNHYDFFVKCLELLRRRPELVAEMRRIPVPSIPRASLKKGRAEAEP